MSQPGIRCSACGAPISDGQVHQSRIGCRFCGTWQLLTDSGDGSGIHFLGELSDFPCPVCDEPLEQALLDDVRILACAGCGGFAIADESFAAVVQERRARFEGDADRAIPIDLQELHKTVDCPRCRRAMDVHPYYGPGNVVIDSCHRCRLIWLDSGELRRLERAPGRR